MTSFLSLLLAMAILTSCSVRRVPAEQSTGSSPSETETMPITEPTTEPATAKGVIGPLEEIPAGYLVEAEEQGEVVRLDYTTADWRPVMMCFISSTGAAATPSVTSVGPDSPVSTNEFWTT